MKPFEIRSFTAAGFGENAYLLRAPETMSAVAIDPGGEADRMADVLAAEGLTLAAILITHAHLDHVEGVGRLARRTGAPIHMHPADQPLYQHVVQQGLHFGLPVEPQPPVDHELEHGQQLALGGVVLEVRHVPGHSPGHVLFYSAAAQCAFVGDVVFQGSIGRTDLPGGNFQQLMRSIREQVLTLPPETVLYSGHGPATTVGAEAVGNPFLIPHYGGGLA